LKWVARLTLIVLLNAMGVGTAAAQGQPQGPPAFVTIQSAAQDEALNVQTLRTSGSPSGIRAGHILVRFKDSPKQDVLD
jgi:hypothetical protein